MSAEPNPSRSLETILHGDLRADTRAQPGDRERLARMVGGAMAATTGVAALWLLLRALLSTKVVVIAVATATMTAATAWVIARPSAPTVTSTTRPSELAAPRGDGAREPVAAVPAATPPPATPIPARPTIDVQAPIRRDAAPNRPEPQLPRSADAPPIAADADALLERAAIARHDGRTDDATLLYREIARSFAGSREDAVACVALGRMLLAHAPADALAAFDRCLADHPRGQLVEAALVGRADALGRLRRGADERAAWSELLRRFPDSLHASRARERLKTTF